MNGDCCAICCTVVGEFAFCEAQHIFCVNRPFKCYSLNFFCTTFDANFQSENLVLEDEQIYNNNIYKTVSWFNKSNKRQKKNCKYCTFIVPTAIHRDNFVTYLLLKGTYQYLRVVTLVKKVYLLYL